MYRGRGYDGAGGPGPAGPRAADRRRVFLRRPRRRTLGLDPPCDIRRRHLAISRLRSDARSTSARSLLLACVLERRHGLQGVLGCARESEFAIDLPQLTHWYRNIVLADAQEAADPDDGVGDCFVGGDDEIVDRSDPLALVVVDRLPEHLTLCTPAQSDVTQLCHTDTEGSGARDLRLRDGRRYQCDACEHQDGCMFHGVLPQLTAAERSRTRKIRRPRPIASLVPCSLVPCARARASQRLWRQPLSGCVADERRDRAMTSPKDRRHSALRPFRCWRTPKRDRHRRRR